MDIKIREHWVSVSSVCVVGTKDYESPPFIQEIINKKIHNVKLVSDYLGGMLVILIITAFNWLLFFSQNIQHMMISLGLKITYQAVCVSSITKLIFLVSYRYHSSLQNRMSNERHYNMQHWEYKKLTNSLLLLFFLSWKKLISSWPEILTVSYTRDNLPRGSQEIFKLPKVRLRIQSRAYEKRGAIKEVYNRLFYST